MSESPVPGLTPKQAAVLAWRMLLPGGPMPWSEVARRLDVPEELAKMYLSAACSKIRRYAGEHYPLQGR